MATSKKTAPKKTAAKKPRRRDGTAQPDEMTIVQVAHALGIKYLRARDVMLAGKCGDARYDGRTLLVKRAGVEALRAKLATKGSS